MHVNISHNPLWPKKDQYLDPFSSKELWDRWFEGVISNHSIKCIWASLGIIISNLLRTTFISDLIPCLKISANKRTSERIAALRTWNKIRTNIKLSNLFKIATSSYACPLPNVSLFHRVGYISLVMSIIPCNEHRSDFQALKFLFLII